jgi:hypothetical protein
MMIRKYTTALFLTALLASCLQTPQVQQEENFAEPAFGYVNDSLTFDDLPNSNDITLQEVKPNECKLEDGPYQRWYSLANSATNAVQFTATVPVSNSGISSSEPGYVYAGGYADSGRTMDFGLKINPSNEIEIFTKQDPALPDTNKGFVTVDLLGALSLDSSKLQPPHYWSIKKFV